MLNLNIFLTYAEDEGLLVYSLRIQDPLTANSFVFERAAIKFIIILHNVFFKLFINTKYIHNTNIYSGELGGVLAIIGEFILLVLASEL